MTSRFLPLIQSGVSFRPLNLLEPVIVLPAPFPQPLHLIWIKSPQPFFNPPPASRLQGSPHLSPRSFEGPFLRSSASESIQQNTTYRHVTCFKLLISIDNHDKPFQVLKLHEVNDKSCVYFTVAPQCSSILNIFPQTLSTQNIYFGLILEH